MLRFQDYLLLLITFSSIAAGIAFPRFGRFFQPFPVYCMVILLFLAFLSIPLVDIWKALRKSSRRLLFFTLIKLIVLPAGVFFLFRLILPDYALAAMLLSGISTGVVSPFFAALLEANIALVLILVVLSSILVPFTVPMLVKVLAGRSMEISFFAMMRLLSMVVLVPICLVEILRRISPALVRSLIGIRYGTTLVMFAVTNLGIFSMYGGYLRQEPMSVLTALLATVLLAVIFLAAGALFSWGEPLENQLALMISFAFMNNVLVIVFSSQFFTPLEPTVAAVYTLPFFALIVPLRWYRRMRGSRPGPT